MSNDRRRRPQDHSYNHHYHSHHHHTYRPYSYPRRNSSPQPPSPPTPAPPKIVPKQTEQAYDSYERRPRTSHRDRYADHYHHQSPRYTHKRPRSRSRSRDSRYYPSNSTRDHIINDFLSQQFDDAQRISAGIAELDRQRRLAKEEQERIAQAAIQQHKRDVRAAEEKEARRRREEEEMFQRGIGAAFAFMRMVGGAGVVKNLMREAQGLGQGKGKENEKGKGRGNQKGMGKGEAQLAAPKKQDRTWQRVERSEFSAEVFREYSLPYAVDPGDSAWWIIKKEFTKEELDALRERSKRIRERVRRLPVEAAPRGGAQRVRSVRSRVGDRKDRGERNGRDRSVADWLVLLCG